MEFDRDTERITMERKYQPALISAAKNLRKNMTKEERHLWYDFLRTCEAKFVRQKVLGKYIADFYCAEAKLVIELDGSQHYDEKEIAKDKQRTDYLAEMGLRVIRFPNNEVMNDFKGVCEAIKAEMQR